MIGFIDTSTMRVTHSENIEPTESRYEERLVRCTISLSLTQRETAVSSEGVFGPNFGDDEICQCVTYARRDLGVRHNWKAWPKCNERLMG